MRRNQVAFRLAQRRRRALLPRQLPRRRLRRVEDFLSERNQQQRQQRQLQQLQQRVRRLVLPRAQVGVVFHLVLNRLLLLLVLVLLGHQQQLLWPLRLLSRLASRALALPPLRPHRLEVLRLLRLRLLAVLLLLLPLLQLQLLLHIRLSRRQQLAQRRRHLPLALRLRLL